MRQRTTPSRLSKPVGTLVALIIALTALPLHAQSSTHTVQPGENLFRIAQRYGVSVNTLAQANNIANIGQIYVGQTLVVPSSQTPVVSIPTENAAPAPADLAAPAAQADTAIVPITQSTTAVTHTVGNGETLNTIAQRHQVAAEQIAVLNGIVNPNMIYVGQTLIIRPAVDVVNVVSAPNTADAATTQPVEPQNDGLAPGLVEEPPMALTIIPFEQIAGAAASSAPAPTLAPPVEMTHTVQAGEHLAQIARQYNVSWLAIAQANNVYDANLVYAGQTLRIPGQTQPASDYGIVGMVAEAPAAPSAPRGAGREILVDLSDSRIYAYENGALVRNVLVSTGLPATPTVQGDFVIERRYAAQTMSGPGYYLPDVPYVQYFFQGYALHGTYWHENWGQQMSRGCVNLPTPEAEWFYNWADIGTPVRVQV